MKTFFVFLFLLSYLTCRRTHGLDINSLITPCSAKDPKLNDCVKEAGQKLIPQIAKGNKEFNIPSIEPMVTPEFSFKENSGENNLMITYKDIVQTGFSDIIIENAEIDLPHKVMTFKIKFPHITFSADYAANGLLLGFDVQGNGKANITVWNALSDFVIKYTVVSDHIKHNSVTNAFSFDKIFLDYTNLILNGDKELSESAGKFINENSAEILEGFRPDLEKFYATLMGDFLQAFFDSVPYSVLFKDI